MRPDRSPFTLRAALERQLVLTMALVAMVLIVAAGVLTEVALAGVLLALLLGTLGVLRAVLPVRTVGALAVRSRGLDAGVLLLLAVGLAALSTSPNL